MTKYLLKQGTLISATGRQVADLIIDNGKIAKIGSNLTALSAYEINCDGLLILPGMIDTHVHFRDPGLTHKADAATESLAALAGGVTTICDMPNTKPQTTTIPLVKEKQQLYATKCLCDFGIYLGAAKDNLEELKRADEDNTIPAVKIFMAESTGEMTLSEDEYLKPIFAQTRKLLLVHAENEARRLHRIEQFRQGKLKEAMGMAPNDPYLHGIVRDNKVASQGTKHAVELALAAKHRMHVLHVSAREEFPFLRQGLDAGLVTSETCPQYLWFTREDTKVHGLYRIMNPALKGEADRAALWEALQTGLISQVATDHAPHLPEEKDLGYGKGPSGLPGVQFVLPLLLAKAQEGELTLEQVVQLTSFNPAQNFQIENKGQLAEGFDADIAIINPNASAMIHADMVKSKCGWTPYEGVLLNGGLVEKTFVRGELKFNRHSDFKVSMLPGKTITVRL